MTWIPLRRVDNDPGWAVNEAAVAAKRLLGVPDDDEVWMSPRYQVVVRYVPVEEGSELPFGRDGMMHLSIHTQDRGPVRNWRHLQAIKNEVAGEDRTAVEIFPPEGDLVDTSNEYHLWVFPKGMNPGYGFDGRLVSNEQQVEDYNAAPHKGHQEPWEEGLPTGPREGEHDERLDVQL